MNADGANLDADPSWTAYWKRADEALASADKRRQMAGYLARLIEHEQAAISALEEALAAIA